MNPNREQPANRLAGETSPYLLQHAHNPVDWYPWGEEAFAKARKEQKPIFLSIGYSACHWCHVMERESFEDPATAAILNRSFVAIKVDREEHPDVDALYMNAVQLMTGSGGWPLSVFLTPDLKPFFGGTYFPAEDRYGMSSFKTVLAGITKAWTERRKDVHAGAEEMTRALASMEHQPALGAPIDGAVVEAAVAQLKRTFDSRWGGFGRAPKFPPAAALALLMRHHASTGTQASLDMVTTTLDRMAQGGLHDQLGGGFHRYSVDEKWRVPHFEKMLYDNALLALVYIEADQLTARPLYRQVAVDTLNYVIRDMTDPSGSFHASQDADSDGVEGKYYVWTRAEIEAVVGADTAALLCKYYGVTPAGDLDGKSVLHLDPAPADFAASNHLTADRFERDLAGWRARLLTARAARVAPGKDTKIIASWNGLMISALARGCQVTGNKRFADAAEQAAAFITASMIISNELATSYAGHKPGGPGYLDDYAHLANGLVDLYEATFDLRWLQAADTLTRNMIDRFGDADGGGLYSTSDAHSNLLVRTRNYADSFTPPGNAVAARVLLRLGRLLDRPRYTPVAEAILHGAPQQVTEQPTGFFSLLMAAEFARSPAPDVAIIGTAGAPDTRQMLAIVHRRFLPNAVVCFADPADKGYAALTNSIPLLRDRPMQDGRATAYVCENFVCRKPTTDPAELQKLLASGPRRPAAEPQQAD